MKKSEGNYRGGSGDRDGGTSSSSGSKRKQTDDESKDEEEKVDDETATNQPEVKEDNEEESSLQLGTRITVRTKTHDGGSSSQVQDTEAEAATTSEEREGNNNNNRTDAFARYSPGTTRRTRVSTEQHISTFLDNNNYQDEQRHRGGEGSGKQL